MFFKILTIITVVKICSGGTPTYPLELKSDSASYSQSFVREDIPLSYQYSAVHVYTPKPNLESTQKKLESKVLPLPNKNKPGLNPVSYPVQYAPIPYKREDYEHQNKAGFYTQVTSPKYYDENDEPEIKKEPVKKSHLEPALELSSPTRRPLPQVYNQFVSGHNIEVLPTPNRSPVSNKYHKINPQTLQEHPNMENYLRKFTIRPETEQPVIMTTYRPKMLEYFTVITTEGATKPPFNYVPEYYNNFQRSFQPKDIDVQVLRQPQVLQPMPSRAKDTKLQLNVARGHKIAQMPHQAHIKHGQFHSYPLHTEAFYKPHQLTISENKNYLNVTRLFPMRNHLQMSLYNGS